VGLSAEPPQFLFQCRTDVITPARNDEPGTFAGEGQRRGATDSGECASDQDYR
jgi:hypothetical protein